MSDPSGNAIIYCDRLGRAVARVDQIVDGTYEKKTKTRLARLTDTIIIEAVRSGRYVIAMYTWSTRVANAIVPLLLTGCLVNKIAATLLNTIRKPS